MTENGSSRATQPEDGLPSFEELLTAYSGYVYAIVARIAGAYAAREDIEDCAADALAALWKALPGFDAEKGDLRHYIAAIARNKAINLRTRGGSAFLPLEEDVLKDDGEGPLEEIILRERAQRVNAAIDGMEPPDPMIFRMRYYWGESLAAIAEALGLTERAVEGRLYRGRQRLKDVLKEDAPCRGK